MFIRVHPWFRFFGSGLTVLLAATAILGCTGWLRSRAAHPAEVKLFFHPFVGPEPLIFNDARYRNPGGEGRFKVRDFQLLLSNIRLVGATGDWSRLDEYLLAFVVEPSMRTTVFASSLAASLELVREGALEMQQARAFAPIYLRRRAAAEPAGSPSPPSPDSREPSGGG